MIDRTHALSLTRQAAALGLSRGSMYYVPRPVRDADLALMRPGRRSSTPAKARAVYERRLHRRARRSRHLPSKPEQKLRRFHGTVSLDPARVGRDASRIADEVIAHLAGQVGADVTVTLEIEASLPDGASDQIVRTVNENSRTLRFTSHGFESE
jgi:hypothetical protein